MKNGKNIPELSHKLNLDGIEIRLHLNNRHQMNHASYMQLLLKETKDRFLLLVCH